MFGCPHCEKALQPQRGLQGVVWTCPFCKGHAASLGVLRKIFGNERVAVVVGESFRAEVEHGCRCPVCQQATARVNWTEKETPLAVDLCRRCEFVWFDPGEYEALAPAPPAPRRLGDVDLRTLPIEVREEIGMARAREIAKQANRSDESPGETWKTVPALLGLPVEIDASPSPRKPAATYTLAALISVVSFWGFFAAQEHQKVIERLGLIPAEWSRDHGLTLLTSFFLHGSLTHLAGNLYFLVLFGRHVEDYLGWARWLLLMAAAALMGDFVDVAFMSGSTLPLIGASGGISGLLAFYALQFPHARLGLLFYLRWWSVPSWGAFAIWVLMQLFGAWQQLHQAGNVASLAHLGGVLAGVVSWMGWRNLEAKPAGVSPFPVVQIR